jgi:hypothetical protein
MNRYGILTLILFIVVSLGFWNFALPAIESEVLINGQDYARGVARSEPVRIGAVQNGTSWMVRTQSRAEDVCNPVNTSSVAIDTASAGNVELVTLTSGQTVYACSMLLVASGTTAVQLITGTGSACATDEANLSGPMDLVANTGFSQRFNGEVKSIASKAFCIENSNAIQISGVLTYRKVATLN